jgi:hypothetical protein
MPTKKFTKEAYAEARWFAALGGMTRLEVIRALAGGEKSISELTTLLSVGETSIRPAVKTLEVGADLHAGSGEQPPVQARSCNRGHYRTDLAHRCACRAAAVTLLSPAIPAVATALRDRGRFTFCFRCADDMHRNALPLDQRRTRLTPESRSFHTTTAASAYSTWKPSRRSSASTGSGGEVRDQRRQGEVAFG